MTHTLPLTPGQQREVAWLRARIKAVTLEVFACEAQIERMEQHRSELIDEIDAIETPDLGSVPDGTDDLPEHYLSR